MVESLPSKQMVEGSSPFGRSNMKHVSNLERKKKLILAHMEAALDEMLVQEQAQFEAGELASPHTVKVHCIAYYSGAERNFEIICSPKITIGAYPVDFKETLELKSVKKD